MCQFVAGLLLFQAEMEFRVRGLDLSHDLSSYFGTWDLLTTSAEICVTGYIAELDIK